MDLSYFVQSCEVVLVVPFFHLSQQNPAIEYCSFSRGFLYVEAAVLNCVIVFVRVNGKINFCWQVWPDEATELVL